MNPPHAFPFATLLLLSACAVARCAEHDDLPPSHSITPRMHATGFEFAEGPAFDRHGNLYVVNYRGNGNIGRITPDGTASIFCRLPDVAEVEGRVPCANGLKVDASGRLIVADSGTGRLLRISADGKQAEVLADRWEESRFHAINDVALDLGGNIYFTDPGGSSIEHPIGSVYRYDVATKQVSRPATGLAFPNGLGVTPDQKYLCVCESQKYRLLIFDRVEDGTVKNRRTLIDFPDETVGRIRGGKFHPDGMIFDAKGRLFVCMWTGGVVNVVEVPSGRLLRQYSAGGDKATNCHFFGPYLFTTVAAKEAVFRLKLDVPGFQYNGPE